jgi:hypothetical protein
MHIQLKNKLWTTNNNFYSMLNYNYSLYFLQFLTDSGNIRRLCYIFILYCTPSCIYIVGLLRKLTETTFFCWRSHIWVITIYVILDYNTVYFKRKSGVHIKITGTVCMLTYITPIVKVDRNKNVTLNRCP